MWIMSQDGRRLVNGDYVSLFYIEETADGAKLMAATDADVVLATYGKVSHAETVLKYIGVCMVDEDAQGKIMQTPTREEMATYDSDFSAPDRTPLQTSFLN